MWLGLGLALPPCRLTRGIGVCRRKPNPDLQGGSIGSKSPSCVPLPAHSGPDRPCLHPGRADGYARPHPYRHARAHGYARTHSYRYAGAHPYATADSYARTYPYCHAGADGYARTYPHCYAGGSLATV